MPVVPRTIEIPAFAPSEPILPRVGRGYFDSQFKRALSSIPDSLLSLECSSSIMVVRFFLHSEMEMKSKRSWTVRRWKRGLSGVLSLLDVADPSALAQEPLRQKR